MSTELGVSVFIWFLKSLLWALASMLRKPRVFGMPEGESSVSQPPNLLSFENHLWHQNYLVLFERGPNGVWEGQFLSTVGCKGHTGPPSFLLLFACIVLWLSYHMTTEQSMNVIMEGRVETKSPMLCG